MKITDFLGKQISSLLDVEPFKNWPSEKSIDDDLDEKVTNYVFEEHGFELSSDQNDRISTIFLYADKYNGFDESLFEVPFSWSRDQVLKHLGTPSKSGGKQSHPILGESGAWDRFTWPDYSIHVEYRSTGAGIKMITLMRNDVVPQ